MNIRLAYLIIAFAAIALSFCAPADAAAPPPVILDITGAEHPKFQVTRLSFAPTVEVDLEGWPHPFFELRAIELTPRALSFGQFVDAGVSRIELTGEAIPMTVPQGTQIVLAILGAGTGDAVGTVTGFWCDSEGDPVSDQTTTFDVRGSPVVFTSDQQEQFRDAIQGE